MNCILMVYSFRYLSYLVLLSVLGMEGRPNFFLYHMLINSVVSFKNQSLVMNIMI